MARRKRRKFTAEFKADAVKLVQAGRSVPDVARELDLTDTALREWVKRAEIDAGKGPPGALTTAEREELAKLRRDVKRLQMERDIRHPKSCGHLLREGERMKFVFIAAKEVAFPVATMCRVLGVSPSGYYAWKPRARRRGERRRTRGSRPTSSPLTRAAVASTGVLGCIANCARKGCASARSASNA